jgi:uncharacterized membrane protein
MLYDLVKTFHILSATWLFGAGCSTAFHMLWAWRSGEAQIIRRVARGVVLADWLFTAIPGTLQPVSGLAMILLAGIDPWSSWLIVAYGLYLLAFACWVPVALIQIRLANGGDVLTPVEHRLFRCWVSLGIPAFSALVAVFYLMVAKPVLW